MTPLPRNKVLWGKMEGAENNATYRPEPVPVPQCRYPLLGQKKTSLRIWLLTSSQTPELVSHQLLSIRQPGYEWTIPVILPLGSVPPAASVNPEEALDGVRVGMGLGWVLSTLKAHHPQPEPCPHLTGLLPQCLTGSSARPGQTTAPLKQLAYEGRGGHWFPQP